MKYLPFIGGAAIALGFGVHHGAHRKAETAIDSSAYTIRGNVRGLELGWVLLFHPGDGPTDTVAVQAGHFELTGKVAEPELCHLVFQKIDRENIKSIGFFLQAGNIDVTGSKDSLGALQFAGAPVQEEFQHFQQKESGISDWNVQRNLARQYAADHPASYVAVEEVLEYFSYNPDADSLQSIYNGLASEIQSSRMGKELKGILDAALLTGVGRPAPEFTQADPNGRAVALASLKGQYVLIDFWASWCAPCRAENPNVLAGYRKFHSKGFTVLGVSLDDKKDQWLRAIRADRLPWAQVSDLRGWKNEAAVAYGVEGIPMNFLLDKDGKIIARGLRGEDLKKKLAEVLH